MSAARRRTRLARVDEMAAMAVLVLAIMLTYWTVGYLRSPTTLLPISLGSPAANLVTAVAAPFLLLLIIIWTTGVDTDPRQPAKRWLLRRLEARWQDWDALAWEEKMRIARRRQAIAWIFAVLGAAAIFVPLLVVATVH